MIIKQNLHSLKKNIPEHVTLVAVSKTKASADIMEAYDVGQRDFGENKVQEMVTKYEVLPKDIRWHMIGHLQRNKIKYMAHFVYLIHGVDSLKLLQEINKQAQKHNRVINCLLQVKIAREDTKFGLSFVETNTLFDRVELQDLHYVKIVGLMGMASFTSDENQVRDEFKSLTFYYKSSPFFQQKQDKVNSNLISNEVENGKTYLSMGMSSDYKIAIEEGSNMVRVGSVIFGARNYITG